MFTGIVYKDTFTTSNQVRNTLRKTGVSFSRFTIEIGRLCTLYFRVFHYSNEEITVKQLQNLTFFISIGPRGSVEVLNFSVKIQMWCEAGICSGVALSTRTGVILQTSHLTIVEHKELPWTAVCFLGGFDQWVLQHKHAQSLGETSQPPQVEVESHIYDMQFPKKRLWFYTLVITEGHIWLSFGAAGSLAVKQNTWMVFKR